MCSWLSMATRLQRTPRMRQNRWTFPNERRSIFEISPATGAGRSAASSPAVLFFAVRCFSRTLRSCGECAAIGHVDIPASSPAICRFRFCMAQRRMCAVKLQPKAFSNDHSTHSACCLCAEFHLVLACTTACKS